MNSRCVVRFVLKINHIFMGGIDNQAIRSMLNKTVKDVKICFKIKKFLFNTCLISSINY